MLPNFASWFFSVTRFGLKTTTPFDVMIVGAGPAGASTWLHLHQIAPERAARAVLIDKDVFPRSKLCGGAVGAWSEDVLNYLNIDLDMPSLQVELEMRYREHHWLMPGPHRVRMIRRADFDQAFVRAGIDRGMVFHESERFIAVRCASDALSVRTSRGRYRVKALVGADGARGRVRPAMVRPRHRPWLEATIQLTLPANPAHDPEFAERRMRADMKTLFIRELRRRGIDAGPASWSSHPIRLFDLRAPIAAPHTLLVGDAAGTQPLLGGGINMALSYGEIAALSLVRAFEMGDLSFRSYADDLMHHFLGAHIRDYTDLVRAVYAAQANPLDQMRDFFTAAFHPPDPDAAAARLSQARVLNARAATIGAFWIRFPSERPHAVSPINAAAVCGPRPHACGCAHPP